MNPTNVLLLIVACICVLPCQAQPEALNPDEEILCGVFYRVMAGALMSQDRARGSDRSALIEIYQQRMYQRMANAKAALAAEAPGEEDGPDYFDEQWRVVYGEMIGAIERNYSRLYILRNRYGERCSLGLSLDE
ncbi:MAG: hypothetical protein O2780_04260 [Proteobacteria bacterium]|jgi:hypothetical protein|nr:hypothetical protein [Pseudomonadota bacterium]MDA1300670.1 hypothetical protein [Pseudomonadota bacterium]